MSAGWVVIICFALTCLTVLSGLTIIGLAFGDINAVAEARKSSTPGNEPTQDIVANRYDGCGLHPGK